MKIRADKLKQLAAEKGMTPETLAESLERTGLNRADAARAIQNWMRGVDHPRCKATDLQALAEGLGVEVADIARFTSQVRHHRGSPRKAKLLADLIRGRRVDQAMNLLTFTTKRAAVNIKKALTAAIADAEIARADLDALYVSEVRVDSGPTIKRFQPKDRGRAHAIKKRTSHIIIGVQERD